MNLADLMARLQLDALRLRLDEMNDAYDMAHGVWEPDEGEILPQFVRGSSRARAYQRVLNQMQSDGNVILTTKLDATVGAVTWGSPTDRSDERKLDERLERFDLPSLARGVTEDGIVRGVMATISHVDEAGQARISRLGGYLEPYFHPDDRDLVTGLYQCDSYLDGKGRVRYWARVYDFENPNAAVIREWRDLEQPGHLGGTHRIIGTPDAPAPIPRFRIRHRTRSGRVLGELMSGAPLLKALWATEARLIAAEEMAAFPMLKTIGVVNVEQVGPGEVVEVADVGGDAAWMAPGELEELRLQRELRERKVARHFAMPGGSLGSGNQLPSGEALQEANRRTLQNARSYAADASGLLTEAVRDYAALLGVDPAPVSVSIDASFQAQQRIATLTQAHALGAVPFPVLARQVQLLIGNDYSDQELREFIERAHGRPESTVQGSGSAGATAM